MTETLHEANPLDDPLIHAARWHAEGEAVALATVTETWGSSPRPSGSRMAIGATGRIAGSVSSGCVESDVVEAAFETLADGQPRLLSYGVSDSDAWSVGLTCGGTIRVFVERLGNAGPSGP
jgi:xanthine dehydrogenase accessory factor